MNAFELKITLSIAREIEDDSQILFATHFNHDHDILRSSVNGVQIAAQVK